MENKTDRSRRALLKGLALVPAAALLFRSSGALAAAPAPHLNDNDSTAKAMGYKTVSNVPGKTCSNCKLWQGGKATFGTCPIFPGKEVSHGAHCNSWVAA